MLTGIRELGIEAITQRFIDEGRKFAEAGVTDAGTLKETLLKEKVWLGLVTQLTEAETDTLNSLSWAAETTWTTCVAESAPDMPVGKPM